LKTLTTKEKILKEGQSLLQKHGYNGFSFQDIADLLKIKKPSLYDHFSSKEELIIAILKSYGEMFDQWALGLSELTPLQQIRKVFDVFYSFSSDHRKVCPVLSLTADTQILTKKIQKEMNIFIEHWLQWLEKKISDGQKIGEIRRDFDPRSLATFVYSQGMGSQLLARIQKEPALALGSGNTIVSFLKNSVQESTRG